MNLNYITRLSYLIDIIPQKLYALSDAEFSYKYHPDKWSKKEVLGHLIDSATNNHQRFVRAKFENEPLITYHQEKWNKYGYYMNLDSQHLIQFWTVYNRHLLLLLQNSSEDDMQNLCNTGSDKPLSLAFLAEDYVKHLEHHLKQIIHY
jgi:hypothetical protein